MFYCTVGFLFGAGLLIFVVQYVGVGPIFEALAQIGLGFFALLGLIALRHGLRALSLWVAVNPRDRRFNLWQAFTTRIGGEAITFLTFTGPVLGEATKAALLKKRMPLSSGVQSLVVDNLLSTSRSRSSSSGACVMLATYDLPDACVPPHDHRGGDDARLGLHRGGGREPTHAVTATVTRSSAAGSSGDGSRRGERKFTASRGTSTIFYKQQARRFLRMIACNLLSHASRCLRSTSHAHARLRAGGSVAYIIDSLTRSSTSSSVSCQRPSASTRAARGSS